MQKRLKSVYLRCCLRPYKIRKRLAKLNFLALYEIFCCRLSNQKLINNFEGPTSPFDQKEPTETSRFGLKDDARNWLFSAISGLFTAQNFSFLAVQIALKYLFFLYVHI
jgi:hypothetical protein